MKYKPSIQDERGLVEIHTGFVTKPHITEIKAVYIDKVNLV